MDQVIELKSVCHMVLRRLLIHGGSAAVLVILLPITMLPMLASKAFSQTIPTLPASAEALLDIPRLPAASVDPQGRYILLVHERGLLPIDYLSQPKVKIAGVWINSRTGGPHAPIAYFGLTLVDLESGEQTRLNIPDGVTIGYPQWSPDGSRFTFTATGESGVELWLGEVTSKATDRLVDTPLNATRGRPCTWMSNSDELLCRMVVERRAPLPKGVLTGAGLSPIDKFLAGNIDANDEQLVDYFLSSQLELINTRTGERKRVGEPIVTDSTEPAPDGQLFLVARVMPAFSVTGRSSQWRRVIQIWDRSGRVVRTFPASSSESTATARAVHWRASTPASVVWVEQVTETERVLVQSAPFLEPPVEIYRSRHRFAGIMWLDDPTLAIVSEFDPVKRITSAWLVAPDNTKQPPRLVWSRSVDGQDAVSGGFLTHSNGGSKPTVRVENNAIFTIGRAGQRSYLETMRLDTMRFERIWESDGASHETIIDLLSADGERLLTRHESATTPPNYLLHDLESDVTRPLTERTHPVPEFAETRRIALQYRRADGVDLSSNLYLPQDLKTGEKLPLLVWAYPRQYGPGATPHLADARGRFPSTERALKLFFTTRGYAVLDDVSMPVVGSTDTANDTFLEQIIDNADAALRSAADTGFVDLDRVGIAGHSYGAFMVANLMAHTRLFAAGVAMSGAYNRTLTPFGFQTERRTLWEARDTYLEMSPLLYSDQITAPLLLVHGLLDDNAGTPPIQSMQLYEAIRYNGGDTDLLLLPFESHSYRARESVIQVAAAMLEWFDSHLGHSEYQGTPLAASDSEFARGREASYP